MEIITELVQNQLMLIVPVGLAILGCILIFTYSIRPAHQPKFKISDSDDRKTAGKKKKLKEKKSTTNGYVTTGVTKSEKSPAKEQKKSPEPPKKEKKIETTKKADILKKNSELQESKKKGNRKTLLEKPVDFDDGHWETVPTKADKKKKIEQIPVKKEKKSKAEAEGQTGVKEDSPEKEQEKLLIELEAEAEPEAETELVVEEISKSVEAPAPIIENNNAKKKPKVNKFIQPEEVAEIAPKLQPDPPQPVATSVVEKPEIVPAPAATTSGAAFDELGDTWTDAKTVKKSKKKARRDN